MQSSGPGNLTHSEIFQQPDTWAETAARVRACRPAGIDQARPVILTGAGTSAFAALAVEAAWPGARAVPSTELFLDFRRRLSGEGLVVSFARSGDSPESTAVVDKIQRAMPGVRHVALTSNPTGALARWPGVEAVLLDPRTNDRSLAMTSSYSNLVLAGLCLARPEETERAVPVLCGATAGALPGHEAAARQIAEKPPARAVMLASPALFGAAREAWLKVLEMTAGRVIPLAETYLGLRHGPMSFLEPDTLAVCFLSSDSALRRYEYDLVKELRAKKLGRLVAIAPPCADTGPFDAAVPSPALPDDLRTPADIVFPQFFTVLDPT